MSRPTVVSRSSSMFDSCPMGKSLQGPRYYLRSQIMWYICVSNDSPKVPEGAVPRGSQAEAVPIPTQGAAMSPDAEVTSRTVNGVEYPDVGTYDIDPSHTELGFAVRHMAVSKVRGRFSAFSGTLVLAEDPADSKASVTIDA